MTRSDWQNKANKHHSRIKNDINKYLGSRIPKFVQTQVDKYNKQVANDVTQWSYIVDPELPLNVTSVYAPIFSSSQNSIELHLDGRFLDMKTNSLDQIVPQNDVWSTKYKSAKQHDQIHISEATVNTYFNAWVDYNMPKVVRDEEIKTGLLQLFPEIRIKYGSDVKLNLTFSMKSENGNSAQLDSSRGVVFGEKEGEPTVGYLYFRCSNNEITEPELALVI